ncbi:MAG: hypothetical protein E7369_04705, partial [Clostridiales bacterium]|nr:hypothetical protein [Clostridiales bacterium]
MTVSVILIDGIFAFIVRWLLPKNWFNENRKIFVAKNSECKFYEHLKIKKWKDKVLELGCFTSFSKSKIVKPKDPEYLKQFIIESNYGIVCHIVGVITK